jgi:hypothetical protein
MEAAPLARRIMTESITDRVLCAAAAMLVVGVVGVPVALGISPPWLDAFFCLVAIGAIAVSRSVPAVALRGVPDAVLLLGTGVLFSGVLTLEYVVSPLAASPWADMPRTMAAFAVLFGGIGLSERRMELLGGRRAMVDDPRGTHDADPGQP